MRLAKFLATSGVASRRAAEEIIRSGRVDGRGEIIRDPARDVDADSHVAVDGAAVGAAPQELVVYAVNKPRGVVSTASDPQGRPTVVALVKSAQRLYPVGRLDADTTGLILLTNDGDLAYRLTHPSFEVDKTYRAVVRGGAVREQALRALRSGVELEDGMTAPARVTRVKSDTLEITIHEGRKRQVKRMCEHVGHRVAELQRIRFRSVAAGRPGRRRGAAPDTRPRSACCGVLDQEPVLIEVRHGQRAADLSARDYVRLAPHHFEDRELSEPRERNDVETRDRVGLLQARRIEVAAAPHQQSQCSSACGGELLATIVDLGHASRVLQPELVGVAHVADGQRLEPRVALEEDQSLSASQLLWR